MISEKLIWAAKIIEAEGEDGVDRVSWIIGKDLATAMLVMHLRRNLGSADSFPSPPEIDTIVTSLLQKQHLDGLKFAGDSGQNNE